MTDHIARFGTQAEETTGPATDPMSAASRPRRRRRVGLVVAVVVVVAGVALGTMLGARAILGGESVQLTVVGSTATVAPAGDTLRLTHPKDWRRIAPSSLAPTLRNAVAALRTTDRKGLLVVSRQRVAPPLNVDLAAHVDRELRKKFSDYKPLDARILNFASGSGFFLSYARTEEGTLHTMTIVPAEGQSFVIDTVSDPRAVAVAEEINLILRSISLE